jgi:hypothetical protein
LYYKLLQRIHCREFIGENRIKTITKHMSLKKLLMPIGLIVLAITLIITPSMTAFARGGGHGGGRGAGFHGGRGFGGRGFGNNFINTLGEAALLGGLFGGWGGYGYGFGGGYPYYGGAFAGAYPYYGGAFNGCAAYANPCLYGGAYANPYLYGGGLNLNGGFNYPGIF